VTSATNPSGILEGGVPADAADKEFMDVDPDTGRVMLSWSNFTPAPTALGGVEIRTTYSDNLKTAATPTWSPSVVVASTEADGQASIPRFAKGNNKAYVAWRRFPFPGTFFGLGNSVALARSLDNGATWQMPIETAEFFTMDQVLGNDRVNTSPSLAVDNSHGSRRGTVYLVYANNNSGDGADIMFQKSTDGGQTLTEPIEINAAPGEDRPQWFPWVSVDNLTGSSDLISIRGRATSQRPFTTVEEMRRAAEESFRGKEKELQQKLSDTERKLAELQSGKSKDQEMILSPEQRAELQRFLDQKVEVRKELRQVRRGLDDKIEALGTRLKLVNIALMPFLITAAALGFAAWKRRRRTL